jgi:hypothetical protein
MIDRLTLPNTSPENISVINVHHNPLIVQRILVYWTIKVSTSYYLSNWERHEHITSGVITRNIAAFRDLVIRASVRSEPWSLTRGWR